MRKQSNLSLFRGYHDSFYLSHPPEVKIGLNVICDLKLYLQCDFSISQIHPMGWIGTFGRTVLAHGPEYI